MADLSQADGTCAIEPLLLPGRWSGRAKLADLAEASYVVIDGCVDGKPLSGGVAWGFGTALVYVD